MLGKDDDADSEEGGSEDEEPRARGPRADAPEATESTLLTETVRPRDLSELPPLFTRLEERRAEALHYIGVAYGLTQPLYGFWSRLGYRPLYVRQTMNDITGEHTCIMLKALATPEMENKVRFSLALGLLGLLDFLGDCAVRSIRCIEIDLLLTSKCERKEQTSARVET